MYPFPLIFQKVLCKIFFFPSKCLIEFTLSQVSEPGISFEESFNYKFNFFNIDTFLQVIYLLVSILEIIFLKEFFHFIYVVKIVDIELFIAFSYFLSKDQWIVPLSFLILAFLKNFLISFDRGLSILLIF